MPAVEELAGPTAFGKYTLLAKLATGGMGEVFLARASADAGFQRLLVIKRLLPHLTDNEQFVNMFLDEARLAAQLHHPNICQIYELGKVGPDHYMAMEYVEGIQLATLLRGRARSAKLSDPRLTCAVLSQACEALHYAHNLRMADGSLAGVVHRDVNPKNIMVTSAGTVKILDFGVVKVRGKVGMSRAGTLKGTYSYMSPEQLRGESLDRRSDVFSLGIIAWEAVTGRRLFKRPTELEVWRAIAEKPIPRASALVQDVSPELDDAIARALSRDREERFSTARELALALEESLGTYGAPLSTVAIAAEVERCFSNELEELRSLVMRVQRVEDEDEDEDFDAPTRLFDDLGLQDQLAELEHVPTKPSRPGSLDPPEERAMSPEPFDLAAEPTVTPSPLELSENTPSAAPEPPPAAFAELDSGSGGRAGTTLGVGDLSASGDAKTIATFDEAPVQPSRPGFEEPPLQASDFEPPTAPSPASASDFEPPTKAYGRPRPSPDAEPAEPPGADFGAAAFEPLPEDYSIRPDRRLSLILLCLILALGLAVAGHYVWTTYVDDGASAELSGGGEVR